MTWERIREQLSAERARHFLACAALVEATARLEGLSPSQIAKRLGDSDFDSMYEAGDIYRPRPCATAEAEVAAVLDAVRSVPQ